jgi:hypothetical protein
VTGSELLAFTRELLRDQKAPYLWSDTAIYKYLNEGQRLLAERTHCLIDDENYTVDTEIGVRSYTLEDEILLVMGARVSGETNVLTPGFVSVGESFFANTTRQPTHYTLTGGSHRISFYPTPDAVYTVNLVVAIRPTITITAGVTPEVPVQAHLALADYAAAKCLYHNDVDGLNAAAADPFNASFMETVRDLKRQIYQHRLGPDRNVVVVQRI